MPREAKDVADFLEDFAKNADPYLLCRQFLVGMYTGAARLAPVRYMLQPNHQTRSVSIEFYIPVGEAMKGSNGDPQDVLDDLQTRPGISCDVRIADTPVRNAFALKRTYREEKHLYDDVMELQQKASARLLPKLL